MAQLQIKYRKTVDIDPLKGNPRTISDDALDKLCESINKNKSFFEARPIILSNRTGFLVAIAGNQRLKAAVKIDMEEVPTVLIPNLTEKEEKEIIIRDNISNGEFDMDILKAEWDAKDLADWGLELEWDDEEETDDMPLSLNIALPKITVEDSDVPKLEKLKLELEKRGFSVTLKE